MESVTFIELVEIISAHSLFVYREIFSEPSREEGKRQGPPNLKMGLFKQKEH